MDSETLSPSDASGHQRVPAQPADEAAPNPALPRIERARPEDADALVALRDAAARWQASRGYQAWRPGGLDAAHFLARIAAGEVYLARHGGGLAGAYELWWEDVATWGRPEEPSGYVHRLMVNRELAPPGYGAVLLRDAERRITAPPPEGAGLRVARLDCVSGNDRLCRYYVEQGYTVVGEQPFEDGSKYPVTLLEKRFG
ncbi:GNAT family N-acetyltransferase [Allostreptomyces psammosilenae]|uniref:GNAT superfamily N-acetyltransferase n=1 Tax=Allostreptomyces psammosilenae TaxID=1892865 RepID=A0A852ZQN6_9ACTN|nr:GNAT family N-acetyltransferase [Allostreptomyces psammosilenae]NYI03174.1 GNAT superfamily N-acetyltransferase [Allostreptomyces psammosilenae]